MRSYQVFHRSNNPPNITLESQQASLTPLRSALTVVPSVRCSATGKRGRETRQAVASRGQGAWTVGGCASRNLLLVYLTMQAGLGSGETMIARNMHKLRAEEERARAHRGQRCGPPGGESCPRSTHGRRFFPAFGVLTTRDLSLLCEFAVSDSTKTTF